MFFKCVSNEFKLVISVPAFRYRKTGSFFLRYLRPRLACMNVIPFLHLRYSLFFVLPERFLYVSFCNSANPQRLCVFFVRFSVSNSFYQILFIATPFAEKQKIHKKTRFYLFSLHNCADLHKNTQKNTQKSFAIKSRSQL